MNAGISLALSGESYFTPCLIDMLFSNFLAAPPSIRELAPLYNSLIPNLTYTAIFSSCKPPLIRSCTIMFALFAPSR